jgi:EAL domain-containing protein (putative c-di-GMP-specific phosphodiesterase class I)
MNLAMMRSMNEIGQVTGKKTVAEFVENDAILEKLREIGVDYTQGYGIGMPRPLNEVLEHELTNCQGGSYPRKR